MSDDQAIQKEVDQNYQAFKESLPELMASDPGKYALLRHKEIVQVFDSARDANIFAEAQFADGLYSIQQVTDRPVDLGFFSHAMHVTAIRSDGGAAP